MRGDFFSTVGEIIKYGGSTFVALVAVSIYQTTDGFFIGNWIGSDGLGALALVSPIMLFFIALADLFEIGGSSVVAEIIGEGKKTLAEKIMRSNYLCAAVIGVIIAILGHIFAEPLMRTLADSPDEHQIVDMAISYLRISFYGLPFLLITYLTSAFMRCVDKPYHVLGLVGSTSLVNVILDALFVVMLGWGMQGAALATFFAQVLGAVIAFWYFKYSRQKFTSRGGFSHLGYIFQEFRIGAGFAIATMLMCFIEYFLNAVLLEYDATHLLVSVALANMLLALFHMPLEGLDTGVQSLISRSLGANQKQHCMKIMRYDFNLTLILSLIMYALMMIFTEEIARVFVQDGEPVTPEMITFLRLVFIVQPLVAMELWMNGMMASLGDEWRNMIKSFTPLIIQAPLILLLPKILPIEYIALNYTVLDIVDTTLAFLLIRPFLRDKGLPLKKIFS